MAAWSILYPLLMPHVPGVSEPLADQALRSAAQEFFRRTTAWRQWLPAITLTTDTSYALALPTGSLVVKLMKATLDGRDVPLPNWNSFEADLDDNATQGVGITTSDRISVQLAAAYAPGGALKVQAALTVSDGALTVPDAQAGQHSAAIVQGAKAILMAIPRQEFTDLTLAAFARGAFEDAIGTAQYEAHKGFGRDVPRMKYRRV